MKSTIASLSLAALMATTAVGPMAQAQTPPPAYDQSYQNQQDRYQDQQSDYAARDAAYREQRRAYERSRDDYDAAHGSGAFIAYYSAHPGEYDELRGRGAYARDFGQPVAYDHDRVDAARRHYDRDHGDGAFAAYYVNHPGEYDVRFGPGAYVQDFGRPVAYQSEDCHQAKQDHAVVGGVLGAVAGAVIGSNLASGGGRLGGSIIGGVLGAGAGGAIAKHATHC
jgi:hypothetical protein